MRGHLSRQTEALENAVFRHHPQREVEPRVQSQTALNEASALHEALMLLVEKLRQPYERKRSHDGLDYVVDQHQSDQSELPVTSFPTWEALASTPHAAASQQPLQPQKKRQRLDSTSRRRGEFSISVDELHDVSGDLPPPELMAAVIDVYFRLFHPWIPILHEKRFRRNLRDPDKIPRLSVILHAMVVAGLKHVDDEGIAPDLAAVDRTCERCRNIVVLTAMDNLYVENLQALIIVAFDDVRVDPLYPPNCYYKAQKSTTSNCRRLAVDVHPELGLSWAPSLGLLNTFN